ncbi:MAG: PDZ domain-containing protein, partial [Planctomycetaceae bacterium]|nr:PDZ domain-containing protein [Planctomycetaceae bacterium]
MERRLLTFIIASTAFFLFYAALRAKFLPPPPPPVVEELEDGNDGVDIVVGEGDAEPTGDGEIEPVDPDPSTVSEPTESELIAERSQQPTWMTLGSMNPSAGYMMLVTLNSRGGGIERIELTERKENGGLKYARVDVRSGYLGYFAGQSSDSISGVKVNVVGPGTPAELAGIEIGDVIIAVAGQTVATPQEMTEALLSTKPGDVISVEVVRGEEGASKVLSATLTDHPLDLIRLARDGGADQVAGNLSQLSCLVSLSQINRKSILPDEPSISTVPNPAELIWDAESTTTDSMQSASFKLDMSAGEMKAAGGGAITMHRRYGLNAGSYVIDMSIELENRDDKPQELAYRLDGPNGITLEGWWYSTKISPNFSGSAARDLVYNTAAEGHELISGYTLLKHAKKQPDDPLSAIFAPDGSA